MRLRLDYGSQGLEVDLPDERVTVIEPAFVPAIPNPHLALVTALRAPIGRPPLRDIVSPGQKIAISVCDITRAQPREVMLRALFEEMPGINPDDVTILIATGTHRTNTPPSSNGCSATTSWPTTRSSIMTAVTTRRSLTSATRRPARRFI